MRRMKQERLHRGWSQVTLAYKAKVAIADVSRIETGRGQPYPDQAKRLARALGIDPATLLDEVTEAGQASGPEAAA